MRLFRAVGRFCYDLVIGDDWRIAACTVGALTGGAILVLAGARDTVVALGTSALIAAGFVLAILAGARRG
jgi:hypothetical protein